MKSEKLKVKNKPQAKAKAVRVKKKEKKVVKKIKGKKLQELTSLSPIDLKALLEAGCHFGHRISKTHPKSIPFLYGKRGGVQIFDLIKTAQYLEEARDFLFKLAAKGEKVLLVGTKRQAKKIIRKIALETKMPFVHNRWLGGTLTNWEEMNKRIKRLKKLTGQIEEGVFKSRTKKEQSLIRKEIVDLREKFGGMSSLEELPSALLVVDIMREKIAVAESRYANIPIVAIADSNTDPGLVDYPIPGNDDARKSIELIVGLLGEAIIKGSKSEKKQTAKSG
ncbi:30S ribosomal protein S2 [Candidatus Shapirobacteria bacterium]|nr:30S ribosomal protein S2 [Candidatus Shapirobacteria bacterium]